MGLEATLYPGESVVEKKAANAVISLHEHGLEHLEGTGWVMARMGFAGKEAIGGHLYLTDRRLIFQSHALNRVRGQMSILLPAIARLVDASGFISKKLRVETATLAFEFVVWGVKPLITAIWKAKETANSPEILDLARRYPGLLGTGLERDDLMDFLARGGSNVFDLVTNPMEIANLLTVYELYELATEITARETTGPSSGGEPV